MNSATWEVHDTNFDNIVSGMVTLFVLSTLEGWPDWMFYFIDAGDDEFSAPIKDNN